MIFAGNATSLPLEWRLEEAPLGKYQPFWKMLDKAYDIYEYSNLLPNCVNYTRSMFYIKVHQLETGVKILFEIDQKVEF